MSKFDTTCLHVLCQRAAAFAAIALLTASYSFGQHGLTLSANADFSTHDRLFSQEDEIHILVDPGTRLDLATVTESTYEIDPVGDGESVEGRLEIRDDGTFTSRIAASGLSGTSRAWRLRVSIEDGFEHEFEARTAFVLRTSDEIAETFRYKGRVESATSTELVVDDQTFAITSETKIHFEGQVDPSPDVLIGEYVVVVAQRMSGGSATALQIFGQSEQTVRFLGPIEAIGSSSITLHGSILTVTDQTTISSLLGQPLSMTDLNVGMLALVSASRSDGVWVAASIVVRIHDMIGFDDSDREIRGEVEAVGESTLVVSGLTFDINGDTEFDGVAGIDAISTGMHVEVTFRRLNDGSLLAVHVEVDDEDDGDDDEAREIEVDGLITATSNESITVGGFVFVISADTRIEGDNDVELELDDLHTGLFVEARGTLQSDGIVEAHKIEVESDSERDEIVLRGEIVEIDGSSVTIGTTSFLVTADTRIRGRGGSTGSMNDLEVGVLARATLSASDDGTLVATDIKIRHRFEARDILVAGRIESVSEASVTIHGVEFEITAETEILDTDGEPVAAGTLHAGLTVRVDGERRSDGRHLAYEIRVLGRIHHEGQFAGFITAVAGGSIDVNGTPFMVNDDTMVDGAAALEVGQRVRLRYRLLGDGSRLALRIQVHAEGDTDTEITGHIEEVGSGTIVINGVRVHFTAASQVRDADGNAIAHSTLKPGDMLDVDGTATPDGIVAARADLKHVAVVGGAAIVNGRTVMVAGVDYTIDDHTLVISRGNARVSLDAVGDGAFVEIIAVSGQEGGSSKMGANETMYAERVLVTDPSVSTALEDEDSLPDAFTLDQNYPNPFNPSTTIAFEVAPAGDRDVLLTIFDVLGRKVRTLVDTSLSPGAYAYTWNGTDDAGRLVASGVYLYRLEVGRFTATRTMAFLK